MSPYDILKQYLFLFDPEEVHLLAEKLLHTTGDLSLGRAMLSKMFSYSDPILSQSLWDIHFPNPVGLGAGFDKNGHMARALIALGLGHIEIGTVTPKPQEGNPKPRIFRHPERETIQNAMGFNNDGMDTIAKRVEALYPALVPVGANIGKNKITPADQAIDDYITLVDRFAPISDYLVVNISSPNTVGLRDLQNESFLTELFGEATKRTTKPILLKIAPDMTPQAAIALSQTAVEAGAKGIIATNTTIDYTLIPGVKPMGGLSGQILREKSFALFDALASQMYGHTTLISVGGIDNGEEAYRRIKAGASLIEVYTGFIFKGPACFGNINRELAALLRQDGFESMTQAIGVARK